ncbi:hypothetical protein [Listeria cornellensis]|uniref:Uncharacterized protein n=1 Tax=Listeria cornellensis FSL F6-0969 TaxID=1265820 RepID=W7C3F1_9LIST|nr:hypothetical protein [Listeria cornellensis]EUJ30191.1 hypothetical protein PCORN_08802 [Listeria cornellensis FSL F6-0969]
MVFNDFNTIFICLLVFQCGLLIFCLVKKAEINKTIGLFITAVSVSFLAIATLLMFASGGIIDEYNLVGNNIDFPMYIGILLLTIVNLIVGSPSVKKQKSVQAETKL